MPLSRLSAKRRRREPVAEPPSVANGPPLAHACSRSRAARQKEEWRELRPYAPSASLVPERLAVARAGHAQHLDEVTWTTKNWHGLQMQRLSVVLHTAVAWQTVNELACGESGIVHGAECIAVLNGVA